nr:immunoglobulin light chain junction region [Macaca mulatta]
CQQGKSLPLTF